MKKTTVTIGIPAFQAEQNIKNLLISLVKQQEKNIRIEKILVYADGCTDDTVNNARSLKGKKIQVIAARKNRGFSYALQSLIKRNNSQIFVILNDDIKIDSSSVIEELSKPLIKNKKVGLVGGNIKALEPRNFIGKCIYTSYLAFAPLRYSLKNGQTDLTCDGKILALRKDFSDSLKLSKLNVGNVDIYLYYENLKQQRLYRFAKKAIVYFRLPETIKDFKNQEARSEVSRNIVKSRFSNIFISNHNLPKILYYSSVLRVALNYPIQSLFFKFFINRGLNLKKNSFSKWKLALSTKKLSILLTDFESLISQFTVL